MLTNDGFLCEPIAREHELDPRALLRHCSHEALSFQQKPHAGHDDTSFFAIALISHRLNA